MKIGVSGILIRYGHVLLGKRQPNDTALPSMWCSPGGGVEEGEHILDALRREFREEVLMKNISIHENSSHVTESFTERGHTMLIFYLVENYPAETPECGPEFSEVRFWSREEILAMPHLITPLTMQALEHFFL